MLRAISLSNKKMRVIERVYSHFLECSNVSTNSRKIEEGSIFFALKGASFDGNKFAMQALEDGAKYCVIDSQDIYEKCNKECSEYADRLILVDDVLSTLQELARHHRRRLGIKVIALTGSNGKTTTKELLTAVLSKRFRVTATVGNLNNHIGVPLTLLSMNEDTEIGVVEMGASAQKEIELLCSIAEPNFGVVTNIGRAHLEGFGGEDGVKRGKGELFAYLAESNGAAFVPIEDETVSTLAEQYFGAAKASQQVAFSYALADGVRSQLEGEYNRYNIAAAVAIGGFFDIERAKIEEAIAEYAPQNNRSQRVESGSNILIMDCYNANPSSMKAAIENFAAEDFGNINGIAKSKVVILGDMLELGEWSDAEHREVIDRVRESDIDLAIFVGELFGRALASLASLSDVDNNNIDKKEMLTFEGREQLCQYIIEHRERFLNRAILVKGSRSVGLEVVANVF